MQIHGKVALVTGAAQRVGRVIALELARNGARIGLHYNSSRDAALALADEIDSMGAEVRLLRGNFSEIKQVESVVTQCVTQLGQIDILVNNAAGYFKTPLESLEEPEWDSLLNVNLKAAFFCSKFAAQNMLSRQTGNIISITDVAAQSPWPDYLPYCISKAGLYAMTRGLAKKLAPSVRVNAIASGTVLLSSDTTEKFRRKIEEGTLLKRIGSPDDIAKTVIYLVRDADYITGEIIAVDGGSSLA